MLLQRTNGYSFLFTPLLAWIASFGASAQSIQDYTMTVEEYAIDGVAGQTTYRFYINMVNSDDFLGTVFGNEDDPFELSTTTSFYNDPAATGSSGGGVNPSFLVPPFDVFFPGLGYDSWYTIGIEVAPSGAETDVGAVESLGQPWIGCFDATSPISGQSIYMNDITGGAWYVMNGTPNGLPDAENQRVLIAQVTTDGNIAGIINAQIFINGNGDNDVRPRFPFAGTGTFEHIPMIGCTDPNACNFLAGYAIDDGSCTYPETFYNCVGNCVNDTDGDGICDEEEVVGCTDPNACNYNPSATDDDGNCLPHPLLTDCDGNCLNDDDGDGICNEEEVVGCTDTNACNFMQEATDDDSSCLYDDFDGDGICNELEVAGCTFTIACNYNPNATDDDGSCEFYCPGCTDEAACNFDINAIQEDNSCVYPADLFGVDYLDCDGICINDLDDDGICDEDEVWGCQNHTACNFNPEATDDDGSCIFANPSACEVCDGTSLLTLDEDGDGICNDDEIPGCTSEIACNFNPEATDDDGSCLDSYQICSAEHLDCDCNCMHDSDGDGICDEDEVPGCMNPIGCNFNPNATDPLPCETISCAGCIYPFACNFDPEAVYSDGSCEFGTCAGCTDPTACNFNPTITEDDGSCTNFDECDVCGGNGPELGYNCDGSCTDSDEDGVCDFDESGCTDTNACNFDPLVNEEDGSCTYPNECFGCDNECFDLNENSLCDCDETPGCTDGLACNFNAAANIEDDSCLYPEALYDCSGACLSDSDSDGLCDELDPCPFDAENDADSDGICANDEVGGCTNPEACNFDDESTDDDGSCVVITEIESNAYNQGEADGFATGYEAGSDAGYASGYQDGSEDILNGIDSGEYCGPGTIWDASFGFCIPSSCFADFNGDGVRGTEDLLQLLAVFDTPCPLGE